MKNLFNFFLYFLTFFIGNVTFSQNEKAIDERAKNLNYPGTIASLVDSLTLNLSSDKEKARAIYSWIAYHIEYDFVGLKNESKLKVDPLGVISKGKSVCQGYANLFNELATIAGLESEVVVGWAKNGMDKIGKIDWESSNHAWNAVKIDNKWQLIDVTWGSGYGRNNKFIREFNAVYFCTPPEKMILNHYPEDEKWKLGVNVSKEMFDLSPNYYTPFLMLDIKKLNQTQGYLQPSFFKKTQIKFECDAEIKNILLTCDNDKTVNVDFTTSKNRVVFDIKVRRKYEYYMIYINNEGVIEYTSKVK
jgi:hypothetical protein